MSFNSLQCIVDLCIAQNISFAQAVRNDDLKESGLSAENQYRKMQTMWNAMINSCTSYDPNAKSSSKLTGGDGGIYSSYIKNGDSICGGFIGEVIKTALQVAESNACMKRIVASPTAGSCGVLPAVLIPYANKNNISEDKIIDALFVAAGIGQVIALRASISGAQGGCQAEIGSASAMAAGCLVYLKGGDAKKIVNASGFSLQNLLGLVCDPVAGLVEVPCIKRNVIGAVNALSCADMALAGIEPKIPADEVIDAMRNVGNMMDLSLKETGKGGLAATPSARKIAGELNLGI